jgi:hypothetical protein
MKFLVLVAIVALASAAPVEESKPASDEKPREKSRLVWPMPDVLSEGDLMLHGRISFDRVRDLHKAKLEEDVDKMILAHGRLFLRRVSKFFDDNADFKILSTLCKDSRNLNNTNRWRIEIPKEQPQAAAPIEAAKSQQGAAPAAPADAAKPAQAAAAPSQRDSPLPKDKVDEPRNNASLSNETDSNVTTTVAPSSEKPGNSSDKPTERPSGASSTTLKPEIEKPAEEKDSYEVRRRDFYRRVGENFARLLMKEYRKETMVQEETEYLARWIADEAVHYGAMAIYCGENENVKEIKKNLAIYLEEKTQ